MTTYTQADNLADILEKARQEGGVYIRHDGLLFLLKPEQNETRSPFDIKGVKTNITREEIIEAIHEGRGNDRW